MKDWETIIDINGDMLAMKHLRVRGIGQKRCGLLDQVTFKGSIYQTEGEPLLEYDVKDIVATRLEPAPPTSLLDMLLSAKAKEEFFVEVQPEYIKLYEKNQAFFEKIDLSRPVYYDIKLETFKELIDLFGDGSSLKKIIKPSYSTSAPDANSRVYYDFIMYDKDDNLLFSSRRFINLACKEFLQLLPSHDDVPSMEERGTQKAFLDEYEISEALHASLKLGKKLEEFELIINDLKHFDYGTEVRKCKKIIGDKSMESILPLKLRVKCYFFSVGENCYSMGQPEKIQYCEMKKPKIAAHLKQGEYVKAKSMLEGVREMCERVYLSSYNS